MTTNKLIKAVEQTKTERSKVFALFCHLIYIKNILARTLILPLKPLNWGFCYLGFGMIVKIVFCYHANPTAPMLRWAR